jgi:gliding-associated putative ABC transporter substrate-binding component GldG
VALIRYQGRQSLVNLYPAASGRISQDEINSAEALMEYQFANALSKLTQPKVPAIVYATGNGQPTDARIMDLDQTMARDYRFAPVDISRDTIPDIADVLMIVKPTLKFTEEENLRIDQFVMRGGKLLCFIDNLYAEQDSLAFKPETVAFDRDLNLTQLFFRYGLRINTDLIMDLSCDRIPFVVGGTQENPQFAFLPWNYYPFLLPSGSAFNRNMGYVSGRFVNSIDTIQVAGVRKTPLLVTSPNSRTISTPALISLNENKQVPEDEKFRRNAIPAAMLLEGRFTSLFRNRLPKSTADSLAAAGRPFLQASPENKMIIVADGDIVLNELRPGGGPGAPPEPLPMGWNRFTYGEYEKQGEQGRYFYPAANRDFLLGCIEYLVNDPGISATKNKDIVLRLLDTKKVTAQRGTWQFVNIAIPVLLVLLAGWLYQQLRKRKYAA